MITLGVEPRPVPGVPGGPVVLRPAEAVLTRPSGELDGARVVLGKLPEEKYARVMGEARRIVGELSGRSPSEADRGRAVSDVDLIRILVAAEINRSDRYSGERLARSLLSAMPSWAPSVWSADLVAEVNALVADYLAESGGRTRGPARVRETMGHREVEDLYHGLPDWMRDAPVPQVADRIAQVIVGGMPVRMSGEGPPHGRTTNAQAGPSTRRRGETLRPSRSGGLDGPERPGSPTVPIDLFGNRLPPLSGHVMGGGDGQRVDVPKYLHFIWVGGAPLREVAKKNISAWLDRANAGERSTRWKVYIWTDSGTYTANSRFFRSMKDRRAAIVLIEDDRDLIEPAQREVYSYALRRHAFAMASDIARYSILLRYGGVYADVDMGPGRVVLPERLRMPIGSDSVPFMAPEFRNGENFNHDVAFYLRRGMRMTRPELLEKVARLHYSTGRFNNGFLVAPPNSSFLRMVYDRIPEVMRGNMRNPHYDPKRSAPFHTGPFLWADVWRRASGVHESETVRPAVDSEMLERWIGVEWLSAESDAEETEQLPLATSEFWKDALARAPVVRHYDLESGHARFDMRRASRDGHRLRLTTIIMDVRAGAGVDRKHVDGFWERLNLGLTRNINNQKTLIDGDLFQVEVVRAPSGGPAHVVIPLIRPEAAGTSSGVLVGQSGNYYVAMINDYLAKPTRPGPPRPTPRTEDSTRRRRAESGERLGGRGVRAQAVPPPLAHVAPPLRGRAATPIPPTGFASAHTRPPLSRRRTFPPPTGPVHVVRPVPPPTGPVHVVHPVPPPPRPAYAVRPVAPLPQQAFAFRPVVPPPRPAFAHVRVATGPVVWGRPGHPAPVRPPGPTRQPPTAGRPVVHRPHGPATGPWGGLRVDDPLDLGWPIGHEIALDVTERGSSTDQERRAEEDRRLPPKLDEGPFSVAAAASGKTAESAYTFHLREDEGARTAGEAFSYTVTSSGRIVLADGLDLPADGWVRHGPDFLHTACGAVLRGDSGWIGRVQNWDDLSQALDLEGLPSYRMRADRTGFYLIPAETSHPSVRVGSVAVGRPEANQEWRGAGPGRGPFFHVDEAGYRWASSTGSSLDANGTLIPADRRFCVEVTVISGG